MTFGTKRVSHPLDLCDCGHPAYTHLMCGDHFCVTAECTCVGFSATHSETPIAEAVVISPDTDLDARE